MCWCLQARKLQDMCLHMAQQGQVKSQITDSYMKQMLEGISEGVHTQTSNTALSPSLSPCLFSPARLRLRCLCPWSSRERERPRRYLSTGGVLATTRTATSTSMAFELGGVGILPRWQPRCCACRTRKLAEWSVAETLEPAVAYKGKLGGAIV